MLPPILKSNCAIKSALTLLGVSCNVCYSVCLISERGKVREEVFGSKDVGGTDDHLPVLQRSCYFVRAANLGETYAWGKIIIDFT